MREFKENLVIALYEAILSRQPESKDIIDQWVNALGDDGDAIKSIIDTFLYSEEFKNNIHSFISKYQKNEHFLNSTCQYGEIEKIIKYNFDNSIKNKFVVDVGARGKNLSNSYDLLKFFNWSGLLIEANPQLIENLKLDFQGLDVQILQTAVSDFNGVSSFTIGFNDDVSSLNTELAKLWGPTKGEINVNVRILSEILTSQKVPYNFGLLSIDIEGEDVKVLNELIQNSSYRPEFIIIEASYNFVTKKLSDVGLSEKVISSYKIVDQTRANLILKKIN